MTGLLSVISGPSGAGKSTIAKSLEQRIEGLQYSVSHTSRKPRSGERDGVNYYFVDRTTFEKMITEGAFVEWAEVYGHLYGTSLASINEQKSLDSDVLMDVDVQGARNIRKRFQASVLIFVLPPSIQVLENRLRQRGTDKEETIAKRMERAADDIRNCSWYDYIVINEDLEKATQEVQAVILSERCRTRRRLPGVKELFDISFF